MSIGRADLAKECGGGIVEHSSSEENMNIPSYINFKILYWLFFSFPSLQVPAIPTIPVVGKGLLNTPQLLAEIVSGKKLQMSL